MKMMTMTMMCPSHSQPLQFKLPEAPFRCSGCGELGFEASYQCVRCGYILHGECINPISFATHTFFPKSYFEFHEKPPGCCGRYCDGCGKDVLGFVYHCSKTGVDLHPCCLNLRLVIFDELGFVKLELRGRVSSKCAKCKHRNVLDGVRGWFYVYPYDDSCCYHVSCWKELILEDWKRGYFSQEVRANSVGMSSGTETERESLGSMDMVESEGTSETTRKYIKLGLVVFKLIFSTIFGNIGSVVADLVEAWFSD